MDVNILAIETSCDETSVSIVKNGNTILSNIVLSQMDIHANYGGVVPEIASRAHVENITIVIEEALKTAHLNKNDITAIAVTYGPGLVGSLLIGLQTAKTLAWAWDKPLIPVHHIAGHIYANNTTEPLEFPLIVLVVSGGHTELILMKEHYHFNKIGGTLDDAVGEAYDKVARVLDLPYPGGPAIDKLAATGNATYDLPTPLDDNSYNFSFSGLKSAIINLVNIEKQQQREINKADLAASFQDKVISILTKKTEHAMSELRVKNLILAGGVAANQGLRSKLAKMCENNNYTFNVPPLNLCTDNAAMIGTAAYFAYQKNIHADLSLNVVSSEELN